MNSQMGVVQLGSNSLCTRSRVLGASTGCVGCSWCVLSSRSDEEDGSSVGGGVGSLGVGDGDNPGAWDRVDVAGARDGVEGFNTVEDSGAGGITSKRPVVLSSVIVGVTGLL